MGPNLYLLNRRACILTVPGLHERRATPYSASLLFSPVGEDISVQTALGSLRAPMLYVPPLVAHRVRVPADGLVGLHIQPASWLYGFFAARRKLPPQPVDEHHFSAHVPCLQALYEGQAGAGEAMELYHAAADMISTDGFVRADEEDQLRRQLIEILRMHPDISLEQLALQMARPYTGMSRLFGQLVGLSLREYKQWLKHSTALKLFYSDLTLTEIAHRSAFTDSAHLSRIFRRTYGVPPSYIRKRKNVQFFRF